MSHSHAAHFFFPAHRFARPRLTRKGRTSALILAATVALPQTILAANRTYVGDTGLWSNTLNWNPIGVPISTDSVFLQTSGSNGVTVTYDASVPATNTTIAGLTIGTSNGGSISLRQLGNNLNVSGNEFVGSSGDGAFEQVGGSHTIGKLTNGAGNLYIGFNKANGIYNLKGGVLTLNGFGFEHIGDGAMGVFNQTDGTHNVGDSNSSELDLGLNGGSAIYNLSGGTLNVGQFAYVGGTFGGGSAAMGTGVFNQTGGKFTTGAWMGVGGLNGSGIYNMGGGTLVVGTDLNIGDLSSPTASCTFNMSNGTVIAQDLWVSSKFERPAQGLLMQTGGSITLNGVFGTGAEIRSGGTYQLLGGVLSGNGVISLQLWDNGSLFVGTNATISGFGAYNQRGGNATLAGTLTVNSAGGAAFKSFNVIGGVATLGSLAGANGVAVIGGGTTTASATVGSFALASLSVSNRGTLQVAGLTPRAVTNSVGALNIGAGNALLDIDKQDLLIDNAATPLTNTVSWWRAAYNNDPVAGRGRWDGARGITSSAARTSALSDGRISIGYLDGAAQNDPNIGNYAAANIGGPALATNRTLLRPTLVGDVNLDGVVNGNDIGLIIGLGYFGKGSAPHGWLDGDLNGDGKVDGNDIGLITGAGTYNNGSYGASSTSAAKAAATLTGSSVVAAAATIGTSGDGKMDYVYDSDTGDVKILYDGDARITADQPLERLKLLSAGGKFLAGHLNSSEFSTSTNTLVDLAEPQGSIPDGYDLGTILPVGLSNQDLISDLSLNWQVQGGGVALKNGDILQVPEPAAIGLIGVGLAGLLARRRRRSATGSLPRRFLT